MNRVDVGAEGLEPPSWSGALESFALRVLDFIGRDNWDLSVLLCGNEKIKALNIQYRGRNEATDVLSFELGAETADEEGGARYLPGDIVISLETLRENARRFETSEDEELRRLLIHGILHLDGMDHASNDENEPMLKLQENLLERLKGECVLPLEEARAGGEG
ncbi:MAG: rRNA maturation RNase YbeY [Treponema sp.]|jgi:probable rRNA maturation factor|nr:rRNA maturation RNase YbeY [Treponema sp.]